MSWNSSVSFLQVNIIFFFKSHITSKSFFYFLFTIILFIISCAPAKRFPDKEEEEERIEGEEKLEEKITKPDFNFAEVRVLLNGLIPAEFLTIESF